LSWPFVTFGIPDEEFLRVEDVPMTKEEIRVLVISKLRLRRGNRVMDVVVVQVLWLWRWL
jgi:Precorrin-6B methylase 2